MISLFIDTSSYFLTVAIISDNKFLSLKQSIKGDTLSDNIFIYIKGCFDEANVKPNDIDKIFVINGPGSFTGIRVGVTIAKTMAWALKIPVVPLSSLELLATTPISKDIIIPYIDARRGYVYGAIYDSNLEAIFSGKHIYIDNLLKMIPINKTYDFVSYDDLTEHIEPKIDILRLIDRHKDDLPINPHLLNPNYLKNTEAEENLNKHD